MEPNSYNTASHYAKVLEILRITDTYESNHKSEAEVDYTTFKTFIDTSVNKDGEYSDMWEIVREITPYYFLEEKTKPNTSAVDAYEILKKEFADKRAILSPEEKTEYLEAFAIIRKEIKTKLGIKVK